MNLRKTLIAFLFLMLNISACKANDSASVSYSITFPEFLEIKTITSPVLTANITDRTGNLYAPLSSRFRVISNSRETKTLYLNATTLTDGGMEDAMFARGARVYVAFANLAHKPKSQSLANCKLGARPIESPGVVAYPIMSVIGAKHNFNRSKGKYEMYIENGTTDISVNVGSHVLKSSFADNDPKGFYQATLSLTEADI